MRRLALVLAPVAFAVMSCGDPASMGSNGSSTSATPPVVTLPPSTTLAGGATDSSSTTLVRSPDPARSTVVRAVDPAAPGTLIGARFDFLIGRDYGGAVPPDAQQLPPLDDGALVGSRSVGSSFIVGDILVGDPSETSGIHVLFSARDTGSRTDGKASPERVVYQVAEKLAVRLAAGERMSTSAAEHCLVEDKTDSSVVAVLTDADEVVTAGARLAWKVDADTGSFTEIPPDSVRCRIAGAG